MKKRLVRRIVLYLLIVSVGIVYYFISAAGYGVPCPIYFVTGLSCPGCGITRMLLALGRGDFSAMLRYNPVLPFILPVISMLIALSEYRYIRYGKRIETKAETVIYVIIIVILVLYGILRNLLPALKI